MVKPVLEVVGLTSDLYSIDGAVRVVDQVSFSIEPAKTLGLVGESGSGKTVTALSILRLLPRNGRVVGGSVLLQGEDLLRKNEREMRAIRGNRLSIVFQDPLTALNPALSIGRQITEAVLAHRDIPRSEAEVEAVEALRAVQIPDPQSRVRSYPHESSGGMQQRILLAMAMINKPDVLIADEPTTALDVTIQAQVLALIKKLGTQHKTGVLLITHNLGVIAQMCDRVAVMYAGEIVEEADADDLFERPLHPYTAALMSSVPTGESIREKPINGLGSPVGAADSTQGCRFRARCPYAEDVCTQHPSLLEVSERRSVRCWVAQRDFKATDGTPIISKGAGQGDPPSPPPGPGSSS